MAVGVKRKPVKKSKRSTAVPRAERSVPTKWRKLLRLLPGYDPFREADGFYFDPQAAQKPIDFCETCLVHVKGKRGGKPFLLEPWQKCIFANIFGWRRADGTRRYRYVLIYIGRKNGKTPMAAIMLLYVLFCEWDPGAELYGAASTHRQACHVFAHAKGMVRAQPALKKRCKVYDGQAKSIQMKDGLSTYAVISGERVGQHGYNTSMAVVDELHEQATRDLIEALDTSTASADRPHPLMVYLTTADYEREGSICNEIHDHARLVRDGRRSDPTFLPVIYEATETDDWTSEKTWEKANPNIDVSVSREYLRQQCSLAQEMPSRENAFKRFHLNMRTRSDVRWLPWDKWSKDCGGVFDADELIGRTCYGGLDLASISDLTALCLVFSVETGGYRALWWFWCPEEGAHERSRRDRVDYETWARQGYLELTDGAETDYRWLRQRIDQIGEIYAITEIAIDRYFQGAQLAQDLRDDGFKVTAFGQGFGSFAAPSREFERLVRRGEFKHGDNPVAAWMAGHVAASMDPAGCIKPDKAKSGEKIDGIVAAVMAVGMAMTGGGQSIYETEGIETV